MNIIQWFNLHLFSKSPCCNAKLEIASGFEDYNAVYRCSKCKNGELGEKESLYQIELIIRKKGIFGYVAEEKECFLIHSLNSSKEVLDHCKRVIDESTDITIDLS